MPRAAFKLPEPKADCHLCAGKGWTRSTPTSWPVECRACMPTKEFRGKVVLDKAQLAQSRKPRSVAA